MTIEITHITVLQGIGTDSLILKTTLPEGCWPFTGNATAQIDVSHGTGLEYVKKHFPGVEPEVINTAPHTRTKFKNE
jgi:hypothetical protein